VAGGVYRQALVEPTEHHTPLDDEAELRRDELIRLFNDPILGELATVAAVRNWLNEEIPTTAMIDLAAMLMFSDSDERYEMLVETNAAERAAKLIRCLNQMRRSLRIAGHYENEPPAPGVHIN